MSVNLRSQVFPYIPIFQFEFLCQNIDLYDSGFALRIGMEILLRGTNKKIAKDSLTRALGKAGTRVTPKS
ncbi:hypothetical protein ACVWYG_002656 [Pedobacter sp. UYEF25]